VLSDDNSENNNITYKKYSRKNIQNNKNTDKYKQDLWSKVQNNLEWNVALNSRINKELNWFINNPNYIKRVSTRAEPYLYHIVTELEKNNVPLEIALLPIVESAYRPYAYSHASASGLWQFIPSTGRIYNMHQNWWYDGRRDIMSSTRGAIEFLTHLKNKFNGDWLKALASYNAGAGRINKAVRKNERLGLPTDYWHLDLPRETMAYVPKLLALAHLISNADKYGIKLHKIANKQHFTHVDTGSQIDLYLAAKLAGLTPKEIYDYNPGYSRWATPPQGPHRILLPLSAKQEFVKNVAQVKKSDRVSWMKYKIKAKDTLSVIAMRHNTDAAQIKKINKLRSDRVRKNRILLIPRPDKNSISGVAIAKKIHLPPSYNNRSYGSKKIYRVKSGDSLWRISKKYKISVNKLAKWNRISKKKKLRIGQRLSLYSNYTPKNTTAKRKTKPKTKYSKKTTNKNHTKKVKYSVKKGDSLYAIASKFNVTIHEIKKWNKPKLSKKYLKLGTKLLLYVAKN